MNDSTPACGSEFGRSRANAFVQFPEERKRRHAAAVQAIVSRSRPATGAGARSSTRAIASENTSVLEPVLVATLRQLLQAVIVHV